MHWHPAVARIRRYTTSHHGFLLAPTPPRESRTSQVMWEFSGPQVLSHLVRYSAAGLGAPRSSAARCPGVEGTAPARAAAVAAPCPATRSEAHPVPAAPAPAAAAAGQCDSSLWRAATLGGGGSGGAGGCCTWAGGKAACDESPPGSGERARGGFAGAHARSVQGYLLVIEWFSHLHAGMQSGSDEYVGLKAPQTTVQHVMRDVAA